MSLSPTQTTTGLVGILNNSILIFCVTFHTPKTVKTYSVIILVHAFSDLTTCVIAIIGNVRVIIIGWGIHLLSNGYCTYLGDSAPGIAYNFVSLGFSYALYLILISFTYRYFILINVGLTVKHLLMICFLAYIPCLMQVVLLELAMSSNDEIQNIVHAKFPDYNLTDYTLNGISDIRNPYAIIGLAHMILATSPIYSTILFLRRKIVKTLKETAPLMSKTTRTMHDQLLKSLIVQAMIPQIDNMTVVFVLLEITDVYSTPFIHENVLLFAIVITVVSPLVSLYFIKPYNARIRKFLKMKVHDGVGEYVVERSKTNVISVSYVL